MPYKQKATPGTVQFSKLAADLPEKRKNTYKSTGSVQT